MGWTEIPAYFCTETKTGRDLIHEKFQQTVLLPNHSLEGCMWPTRTPNRILEEIPKYSISVYLDDFICAAVKSTSGTPLDRISKAAWHGIHSIFFLTKVTGNTGGKDPISIKKMQKGYAQWST